MKFVFPWKNVFIYDQFLKPRSKTNNCCSTLISLIIGVDKNRVPTRHFFSKERYKNSHLCRLPVKL